MKTIKRFFDSGGRISKNLLANSKLAARSARRISSNFCLFFGDPAKAKKTLPIKRIPRALSSIFLFILGLIIALSAHFLTTEKIAALQPTPQQTIQTPVSPLFPPFQGGLGGISPIANNSLQLARELFENGRYLEAISIWQETAANLERQGNTIDRALVLSYLAAAYEQLGKWEEAEMAIASSLNLIKNTSNPPPLTIAQILNTRGQLQLARGNTEPALKTWELAETYYQQAGDFIGIVGSKINQAKALQTLGLNRRAKQTLEKLESILQTSSESLGLQEDISLLEVKTTAWLSLGNSLRQVGELEKSLEVLERGLATANQLNSPSQIQAALVSLGDTLIAQNNLLSALSIYQEAAAIQICSDTQNTCPSQLQVKLKLLGLLVKNNRLLEAENLLPEIEGELVDFPPIQAAVYAPIEFASIISKFKEKAREQNTVFSLIPDDLEIAEMLTNAVREARVLGDARAEAAAIGYLGKTYEENQQLADAQKLTRQALAIAQGLNAADIAYQWQWQLGRIQAAQGNRKGAIAAYTEAVNSLQSLRSDLAAVSADVQFSFQENVEPVYRELVGLLLQPAESPLLGKGGKEEEESGVSQENIQQALDAIESLQLAELDNFFREACLQAKPQKIDEIDAKAAVIHPIILSDRLEVILSIPGKQLRHYATVLPQSEVEAAANRMQASMRITSFASDRLPVAQQIYDWLIRPAEADLADNGIETLVFVLDGVLRNLPMAALHDGDRFLVEKYQIALTPGLQLLEGRSLQEQRFKILMGGLSEASQGFSPLPAVEKELQQIASQVPSEKLLNQQFTVESLQREIQANPFPVVHLATHGQFSSNPDETFILTWDDKIKVNQFEALLKFREQGQTEPIELLILSACQTAAGDKRAALGLAGVAVRSGTRSTLATLWPVSDLSTADLMVKFYQELTKSSSSKAEALRKAQLSLLKGEYQHPFFWAPFVLVGNWL